MNYTELSQAIQDYCQNTESSFVTNIPTFVKQVEERLYRVARIPTLRKSSTGTTTASNRFLAMPTDFLAAYSIAVIDGSGNYDFLLPKDVSFIREAYPTTATESQPKFYALWDENTFLLAPTPDDAYSMQLNYYYEPASIVTSATSWYGDNAETALLYGCLVEAYTYMKGDADILKNYMERYERAVQDMRVLGEGLNRRDSYRSGDARMPST
jgi:hypothetical protein